MRNPNLMTDEELASELIGIAAGFWFNSNKAVLGEAAARLREHAEKRGDCPECGGSGRDDDAAPCNHCGGDGRA